MKYCINCDKDKLDNEMYSKFVCKDCKQVLLDTDEYVEYIISKKKDILRNIRTN